MKITAALAAGGMGEMYRARDTRLTRPIAIQILPSDLADDPDRLRRFEQEAQAASALNHPNILTIYDVGHEAGVPIIAMEWVQGDIFLISAPSCFGPRPRSPIPTRD